jgi:hypothetical protein
MFHTYLHTLFLYIHTYAHFSYTQVAQEDHSKRKEAEPPIYRTGVTGQTGRTGQTLQTGQTGRTGQTPQTGQTGQTGRTGQTGQTWEPWTNLVSMSPSAAHSHEDTDVRSIAELEASLASMPANDVDQTCSLDSLKTVALPEEGQGWEEEDEATAATAAPASPRSRLAALKRSVFVLCLRRLVYICIYVCLSFVLEDVYLVFCVVT